MRRKRGVDKAIARVHEYSDLLTDDEVSGEDGGINIVTEKLRGNKVWQQWAKKGSAWERLDIVVDSGASTSILPLKAAKDHEVGTSVPIRKYTSASKQEVSTSGEKNLTCGFQNGEQLKTRWEVADVHRPLCSVSRMVGYGYHVWFAPESEGGSGAWNKKTGETLKIYERGGVYVLPAWIRPPSKPGFPGPVNP